MTAPLVGALLLSAVAGLGVSWLFIAWPRRMTAEEWIVHRRSFQRAHETSGSTSSRPWASLRRFGGLALLADPDLALLRLTPGGSTPTTQDEALRRVGLVAGGVAAAVIGLGTFSGFAGGGAAIAFGSPAIAVLLASVAAGAQLVAWRLRASSIRTAVRKDLPRLLTGARVLLDSGTANAEQALSAAVQTYADPAAELLREALRQKEVRRVDFETAVDEVADRYGIPELHRLADSLRVGHRYGTGMSALLVEFAQSARSSWHATYRERITRAPVLMTVPALVFFVVPLLVLMMFLVFSPLVGTLSRL